MDDTIPCWSPNILPDFTDADIELNFEGECVELEALGPPLGMLSEIVWDDVFTDKPIPRCQCGRVAKYLQFRGSFCSIRCFEMSC